MFDIQCDPCDHHYLVGTSAISSFHNSTDGPIARVRCPKGHDLIHRFRTGFTTAMVAA